MDENKLGYLLNFGDALMKHGITRTINGQLQIQPEIRNIFRAFLRGKTRTLRVFVPL